MDQNKDGDSNVIKNEVLEEINRDVLNEHIETTINNKDEKCNSNIDGCNNNYNLKNDEIDDIKVESVKADTTVWQDLINSMNIKFLKSRKKSALDTDNCSKLDDVPVQCQVKTKVSENQIQTVQNEEIVDNLMNPSEVYDEEKEVSQAFLQKTNKGKFFIIAIFLISSFLIYRAYIFITEPRPPSKDVVATYAGNNLTKEELSNYITSKGYREEEHGFCEKHGFEHDKCDKTEDCETHPIDSLEAYSQIIKSIAVDKIVEDWAKTKGITQKEEVKHDFKHLVEEVNLDNLVDKVHKDQLSPDKIDKLDVQKYYDENKTKYGDKTFNEVENEIRNILASEKDKNFFPEYIEKLKKDSALNVNFDILKVDDPTETEMRIFYEKNKEKYLEPKKAKILEIKINISDSENDARKKADEAYTKIRAGENFEDVAKIYSDSKQFDAYYIKQGERGTSFEEQVFKLQVNEVSSVFKDENSFYIIKIIDKQEKRQKSFSEASGEVKAEVLKEKEDKQYELRKNEALFSIHGKRFTLGEFKEEFKELSSETQARYADFDAKKDLIEQIISKELLLEESGDDSSNGEGSKEIEELKKQYIQQILHKEEIDEKLGDINDEEVKKFYEEKKSFLVEPPKAKISIIRFEEGSSEAEKNRARQRADEALKKLKDGADFTAVAKEYSDDKFASGRGELNQWIYDDEYLPPELKKNIFGLQLNEISSIFEANNDFYIIKLQQKEDKKQKTFEEVKEELKQTLLDEKHHKKEEELEEELLKKSELVIYNSTIKDLIKEKKIKNN